MNLKLSKPKNIFKSKSQQARFVTERWAAANLYCPQCGSYLSPLPNNTPVIDLQCKICNLQFQLKSKTQAFGKSVPGGDYHHMVQSVQMRQHPSFFLLQWDANDYLVTNVQLIHKDCIEEDCIVRRQKIASGFEGFNLDLKLVLRSGRIPIVYEGREIEKDTVLSQWKAITKIIPSMSSLNGWQKEVMRFIDSLGNEFYASDFEDQCLIWEAKYPNNNHIAAKVRQQLQMLRNKGLIQFDGKGKYRRTW